MPWEERSVMSSRLEFVELASREGANISALCRRFDVSRPTAYKWLGRYRTQEAVGLMDRSRRPHHSPGRTGAAMERRIVRVRQQHHAWGGEKIATVLMRQGLAGVPGPRTVQNILKRRGLIDPEQAASHRPCQRFEHPESNDLAQMDYKGHFAIATGRCHPLTVLDDHSRFVLLLHVCADETTTTVQSLLIATFRRYGLPRRMLMDNGSPWGDDRSHPWTPLTVWLLRLGIAVSHGRPYHPQTQGKVERFHRTLKTEVITGRTFADLRDCQKQFDRFRQLYNCERPHQVLNKDVPISRYTPSPRPYPETLTPIEYGPDDIVRTVHDACISFQGRRCRVGRAFGGLPVALRPTAVDGLFDVIFSHQIVKQLDLR
jgi:transposase InsO family protein